MVYTFETKLVEKIEITPAIYHLRFRVTNGQELRFVAGQYVMIKLQDNTGALVPRMFSIASSQQETNMFDLMVKIEPHGLASTYFLQMSVDETAVFQGPFGVFTVRDYETDMVFVCTGTGFAPIKSMLHDILDQKKCSKNVTVLWGIPTFKDFCYTKQIEKWVQENPNLTFRFCVSQEVELSHCPLEMKNIVSLGRTTQYLDKLFTAAPYHPTNFPTYYLCGAREVVESLRTYLAEKNIPKENIVFEKY